MINRRLIAAIVALGLAAGVTGVATAASGSAPKHTSITESQTFKVKINRWAQDGLRWKNDVYTVRSGGTITIVDNKPSDGPHTFTVVKKGALPRTAKQVNNCKICNTVTVEHGADPNNPGPPKFPFVENGVGQNTPPNIDRPGDSVFVGPNKGDSVTVPVTAKKGTTLHFICIVHPQMQATLLVR